jgi:hypothetical protein
MPFYDIEDQRNIVVATCVLHNFIRIHDGEDEGFKWDESNAGETHRSAQENMENIQDEEMKIIRDNIAQSICGL